MTDGRTERGEQTRRLVLRRATEIASVDGLEGLSIGRLATELNIDESGLLAHFGSEEELRLATVRAARAIFVEEVVRPALAVPPGAKRLWLLCEGWLSYSRRRVFPGGCFFQAVRSEFGSRPGRVHDAVADAGIDWGALLEVTAAEAGVDDPAQLAFEIVALLEAANVASVLHDDHTAYDRARTALRARVPVA